MNAGPSFRGAERKLQVLRFAQDDNLTRRFDSLFLDDEQDDAVFGNHPGAVAAVGGIPYVVDFAAGGEAELLERQGHLFRIVAAVEEADGDGAILERLGPDFEGTFGADAITLFAEGILVDGDDVLVHEDGFGLR